MKISIITPVLNGERFIRQTIDSVLSQAGDFELEYIIKDGGSTDRTLEILKDYQSHPSVKVISQSDRSLYDAINQGFAHATGDIGAWINADDTYEPNALQAVITAFETNPQTQWLYGRCDIVDEKNRQIRQPITRYKRLLGFRYNRFLLHCENYINQPSTFWRMALWREVGGLDLNYCLAADYHLWLKFSQQAKAKACPTQLAHFRCHHDSLSSQQFEHQFDEELQIARNFCNPISFMIHRINVLKIVWAYKLVNLRAGSFSS